MENQMKKLNKRPDELLETDLATEYKELVDRLADAPGVEAVLKAYNDLLAPYTEGQEYLRACEPEPFFINTDSAC